MDRILGLGPALPVALLMVGCTSAPTPPPYKPVADVKALMLNVIEPSAEVVWDAVGTIVTAAGTEELAPKTEEEWQAVLNGAMTLAESGNLLMMSPRARDTGEWMTFSRAMIEAAEVSIRAANAKDRQAIFDNGEVIYNTCTACHEKYTAIVTR